MMAPMTTRTRYEIAKAGATPEFVELCKTLYGEAVDPDEIWDTVIKRGPASGETKASRRRREAQVALASNTFGAGMGALAIKDAVRNTRGKIAGGKLIPTKAKVLAGAAALGQGVNAGGDVVSMKVTGEQAFPRKTGTSKSLQGQLVPVSKIKAPSMHRILGIKPPASKDVVEGIKNAQNPDSMPNRVARKGGQLLATRTGRAVAVTGVAAGAVGATKTVASGSTPTPDPYYYGKSDTTDVTWQGTFSKLDEDKRLAFGWASVTHLNGSPVIDRQGDWIETEEIEKAAYDYVHKSRVGGDMHRRAGEVPHKVSDLVESIVFTDDKVEKMGLPHDFPRGWWVGFKIHDDDTWAEVKKGGRTGFSIHGKGLRKDISVDEVMGYAV